MLKALVQTGACCTTLGKIAYAAQPGALNTRLGSWPDIQWGPCTESHAPESQELAALLRPPHEVDGADAAGGGQRDHKPAQHGPCGCLRMRSWSQVGSKHDNYTERTGRADTASGSLLKLTLVCAEQRKQGQKQS